MIAKKTMMLGTVLAGMVLGTVLAPVALRAEDAPPVTAKKHIPQFQERADKAFEDSDVNKDGNLNLEEFLARHREKFKQIDADSSGAISRAEFDAHGESMREKFKEHRQKAKDGIEKKAEEPISP